MATKLENSLKKWKPQKTLKYKGQEWNIKELLLYFEEKITELEQQKCKTRVGCLKKYQDYMDKRFVKKKRA